VDGDGSLEKLKTTCNSRDGYAGKTLPAEFPAGKSRTA